MSDAIRFLTDENFRASITQGLRLRDPSINVLTPVEAGLLHRPDPDLIAWAAEHERILLSHDVNTMIAHFSQFLMAGNHSPGILLIPQELPTGRAIEEVLTVWGASGPDDWRDTWDFLPL